MIGVETFSHSPSLFFSLAMVKRHKAEGAGEGAVVQTAGDLANWHPHVHALVSRGGWTREVKWVPVAFVDERPAELLFQHKVIRLLQDVGPLSQERTELLLSWMRVRFTYIHSFKHS